MFLQPHQCRQKYRHMPRHGPQSQCPLMHVPGPVIMHAAPRPVSSCSEYPNERETERERECEIERAGGKMRVGSGGERERESGWERQRERVGE